MQVPRAIRLLCAATALLVLAPRAVPVGAQSPPNNSDQSVNQSTAPIDVRAISGAVTPIGPTTPAAGAAAAQRSAPAVSALATSLTPVTTKVAAIPQVVGPIATNGSSYPFNADDQNVDPVDLDGYGYVEQEYLIKGTATVYNWQGTSLSIGAVASGPYVTRILVRKPASQARFSGNVVVELLNPSYGYDLDFVWAAAHDYFLFHDAAAKGDAWIGVTISPVSVSSLKRFNSARYSSLSMANPVPLAQTCTANLPSGVTPATEQGLEWDIVSQLGALLKTNAASSPLAGLTVQEAYASGYSRGGNDLVTYVNAFDKVMNLPNGKPIYDGYMIGAAVGGPTSISQCATWFPPGDQHSVVQPHRVPIIRVNTQTDFGYWFGQPGTGVPSGNTLNRRVDHDFVGDQFRLYEFPGSSHLWPYLFQFFPGSAELSRIGASVSAYGCFEQPPNTFPLHYFVDQTFANLDRWARNGTPPVRGTWINLNNPGTPSETTVTDQWGNAVGGVRTPYLDEPFATYSGYSSGNGCGTWGHETLFPTSLLTSLYPNGTYFSRVTASTIFMLSQGWVRESDARSIIGDAQNANVP